MEDIVSIVLTTYNRSAYLVRRALESVIAQTYRRMQIIVINDCPENQILAIELGNMINKFDKDILYYIMPSNSGACIARNKGLELAEGKYIAFLDDDDVWMPNKIELQVRAFNRFSNTVLVTGYMKYIEKDDGTGKIYNINEEYEGDVLEQLLVSNFIGGSSCPLLKTDAVRYVKGFDVRYQSSQDYNLWLKLAKVGNVAFVKQILINYYVTEDSITSNIEKRIQGWNLILSDFKMDYDKFPLSRQKMCLGLALFYKKNNFVKESIKYYLYGCKEIPINSIAIKYLILLLLPVSMGQMIIKLKKKWASTALQKKQ